MLLLSMLMLAPAAPSFAKKERKIVLLRRIHTYAATIDTTVDSSREAFSYSRSVINVERRNSLLMTVPSCFAVARSKDRSFLTECYSNVKMMHYDEAITTPLIRITTFPKGKHALDGFSRYLTPTVYGEYILGNMLISPFHPRNARFYTYHVDVIHRGSYISLRFKPKRVNTQLVSGSAHIDGLTGRIISCNFSGEYDHVRFTVSLVMGYQALQSLFPTRSDAVLRFNFLGNKINGHFVQYFDMPRELPDSAFDGQLENFGLMEKIRPEPLDSAQWAIYRKMLDKRRADSLAMADSTRSHRPSFAKQVLWDIIGDNVLNRYKTTFGMNNRGYIRINPIMNPLYMGYSRRKGFTYKFDLNFSYQLHDNSEITTRFKAGYAFRLRQFYFRVPIYYYFNKRRNGYVKLEMGNGNHISSRLVEPVTQLMPLDTLGLSNVVGQLNEFKQGDARLVFNYDISSHFSFQVGLLYQLHKAVNEKVLKTLGYPAVYRSFAPAIELQWRPWGWSGPIITGDYDHGLPNVLGSNNRYDRFEFNGEYIHHLNKLQLIEARAGVGFYTRKGGRSLFLNYENFQEDNIPGGWNDDWSGEFELLRSETYNTSDYYFRGNLTYESPLLLLSWLPWVGRYLEMERVYVSALQAVNVHPYVEVGYGFTTRLFSIGAFMSSGQGNRTFGVKFGFELFRNW